MHKSLSIFFRTVICLDHNIFYIIGSLHILIVCFVCWCILPYHICYFSIFVVLQRWHTSEKSTTTGQSCGTISSSKIYVTASFSTDETKWLICTWASKVSPYSNLLVLSIVFINGQMQNLHGEGINSECWISWRWRYRYSIQHRRE